MQNIKLIIFLLLGINNLYADWQAQLQNKVLKASPPMWMKEQIEEDLSRYILEKNNHSELALRSNVEVVLFMINNGEVHCEFAATQQIDNIKPTILNRTKELTQHITNLLAVTNLPPLKFFCNLADGGPGNCFKFSRKKNQIGILLPDPSSLKGYFNFCDYIIKGENIWPWHIKESKLFWRGALTGQPYKTVDDLNKNQRYKVVSISQEFPHEVDARLTGCKDFVREFLQNNGMLGAVIPIENHLKYKYQLLLDGNTTSWARALWQLLSGCVIFKPESEHIQWYYRALKPNEHYIPFNADCSDLIQKIYWARENDDVCYKIAQNATNFAQENLTYADMLYYIYLLLTEYAKL